MVNGPKAADKGSKSCRVKFPVTASKSPFLTAVDDVAAHQISFMDSRNDAQG